MNAQQLDMFNESQPITPVPRPAPTLDDYRAALTKHDWFYEFSDDHATWGNGRNQEARLRLMAKTLDPDLTIWKQYAPTTR